MKDSVTHGKYLISALLLLVLLAGCDSLMGPDASAGRVTIRLGSGGTRAVFAEADIAGFHYELEFQGPGDVIPPLSVPQGQTTISRTLAPGDWEVIAHAYNPQDTLIAQGKAAVTVRSGQNSPVAIVMGSVNADLKTLTVKAGLLSLSGFDPNKTDYAVRGLLALSSSVEITPAVSDPDAVITMTISDLDNDVIIIDKEPIISGTLRTISKALNIWGGDLFIEIAVTAQDKMTVKTYAVTVSRSLF
jgi:hypothetical protein